MKLATYKISRDGQLAVVSRDLSAHTMPVAYHPAAAGTTEFHVAAAQELSRR
jgi:hypothetical protein